MKQNGSQLFIPAVLIVLMTGVLVMSYQFDYTQAKLGPLTISIIILILCVVQLGQLLKIRNKEETAPEGTINNASEGEPDSHQLKRHVYEILWICGFLVAIYLLGFFVSVPLFCLLYMKLHAAKWLPSIIISLLLLVFIYVVFILVLDFRLHTGIILSTLGVG